MAKTNDLKIGKIYLITDPGDEGHPFLKGKRVELKDFFNPEPNEKGTIKSCTVLPLKNIQCGKDVGFMKNQTITLSNAN